MVAPSRRSGHARRHESGSRQSRKREDSSVPTSTQAKKSSWPRRSISGKPAERCAEVRVKTRGSLATNDGEIAVNWALEGHGIVMRAEWDVEAHLRSGRLVRVLPGWHTPEADIYAVVPQRQQRATRVRAFVDFIADAFVTAPRAPD